MKGREESADICINIERGEEKRERKCTDSFSGDDAGHMDVLVEPLYPIHLDRPL